MHQIRLVVETAHVSQFEKTVQSESCSALLLGWKRLLMELRMMELLVEVVV